MTRWLRSACLCRSVASLGIYFAVLAGSAYPTFRYFDMNGARKPGDSVDYVAIYKGHVVGNNHHRYRVLVPYLARVVPVRAMVWLVRAAADRPVELAFFLVNFTMILASAGFMHAAMGRLGFSWKERLLGGALFLTSIPAVQAAATPLVDAGTYLASSLMLWAVVISSPALVVCALVFGIFAREASVSLVLFALLSGRFRVRVPLGGFFVVIAMWLGFVVAFDAMDGSQVKWDMLIGVGQGMVVHSKDPAYMFSRSYIGEFVEAYVVTLPFALVGWRFRHRLPAYVVQAAPWLLFCLALGFIVGEPGRTSFMGFPMLLPFVLLGIRRISELRQADEL